MDTNRIERKGFREYARLENALTAYNKELLKALEGNKNKLARTCKKHQVKKQRVAGIIHISDHHFNELVELSFNRYDFEIGAKRLKKLADMAIFYFTNSGIKDVLIASTGDMLNSDRRLDEMLNMATNRSNATILAVHLYKQFIVHLNQYFNIRFAAVSGNESRAKEEVGFSDILVTDNYDFTIMNFLAYLFKDSEGIEFIQSTAKEMVVKLLDKFNILLLHGESLKGETEKNILKIMGKYAGQDIKINYVLYGNLHSCRIGDIYSRCSSLVGANAYSEFGLHLLGRASQNLFIWYEDGSRDGIKVDLQDVEELEGYKIIEELAAYNAKSASKNIPHRTIFEVRI